MQSHDDNPHDLPIARIAEIDEICLDFETRLKFNQAPKIEDWLQQHGCGGSADDALLSELLSLEVEYLCQQGTTPSLPEYEQRFPDSVSIVRKVFGGVNLKTQSRHDATPPVDSLTVQTTYSIDRFHARGGLGAVYVANDSQLSRQVAVKFSRSRDMDPSKRDRFEREANITGRLEHPGIVPVYAIENVPGKPPSYVMRFIQGVTLRDAVKQFHANAEGDSQRFRSLEFRQVLERLVSVCNTVAYAHGRGIIHRDIKPSNIMLGEFGETLLVDWGLAKDISQDCDLADESQAMMRGTDSGASAETVSQTRAGQALGTPAFASPEQLFGSPADHGPHSDVYSLGATLYYVLTGCQPLSQTGAEVPTTDNLNSLAAPRSRDSTIPRELEAICLKAMSLRTADRYDSAQALANDLDRYLADEPISVLNDPFMVRARRWSRRHPGKMAAIAASVVVGVVGMSIGSILLGEKNRELRSSNLSLNNANQLLTESEQQTMIAKQHTIEALRKLTDDFVQRKLSQQSELSDEDREFLKEVLSAYEGFAQVQSNDPQSIEIRLEGLFRVGQILELLGERNEARSSWEKAIELGKSNLSNQLTPEIRALWARIVGSYGHLLSLMGTTVAAESHIKAAMDEFKSLSSQFPDREVYARDLALNHLHLAHVYTRSARLKDAIVQHQATISQYENLAKRFPNSDYNLRELAFSHNNLGLVYLDRSQTHAAEQEFRRAIEIQAALDKKSGDNPRNKSGLAKSLYNLARLQLRTRRYQLSAPNYKRAIDLGLQLVSQYPLHADNYHLLADSHQGLSQIFWRTGKKENAIAEQESAIKYIDQAVARDPDNVAYLKSQSEIRWNHGIQMVALGRTDDAAQIQWEYLSDFRNRLDKNPTNSNRYDLAAALNRVGAYLVEQGQADEAMEVLEEAIFLLGDSEQLDQKFSTERIMLRNIEQRFANLLMRRDELEMAVPHWERVIQLSDDTAAMHRAVLAVCLARSNPSLAMTKVDEVLKLDSLRPKDIYNLACASGLAAGHFQQADGRESAIVKTLELLKRARDLGRFDNQRSITFLEISPPFAALRGDERFDAFLAQLKSGEDE